jgi:hypothetical protein
MDQKTKKLIFFIGSLFVAVIFVTSYLAFGNNQTQPTSTTSVLQANTLLVYGTANGVVMNYSYSAFVTVLSKSQHNAVNATLDALESSGNISSYNPVNSTSYQAVLASINLNQFSSYISSHLNSSNVSVGGYTYIRLPANVLMAAGGGQAVPIAFPQTNYSVYLPKVYPIGANVPLSVQALVTTQGKIFNNQVRISGAG